MQIETRALVRQKQVDDEYAVSLPLMCRLWSEKDEINAVKDKLISRVSDLRELMEENLATFRGGVTLTPRRFLHYDLEGKKSTHSRPGSVISSFQVVT